MTVLFLFDIVGTRSELPNGAARVGLRRVIEADAVARHEGDNGSPNLLLRLPAAGDNADMSQPFQFSMRRMFGAMTCFSFAAWMIAILLNYKVPFGLNWLIVALSGAAAGAGLGLIAGKPLVSAADGAVLGIWLFFAITIWNGHPPILR